MGFVGYKEASETVVFMSRNKRNPNKITMGVHPAIVRKETAQPPFVNAVVERNAAASWLVT